MHQENQLRVIAKYFKKSFLNYAFRRVSGVGDDVPQLPNFLKVFQESVRENVVGWYTKKPPLRWLFWYPAGTYF